MCRATHCSEGCQRVPLVLVVREAGDKVKCFAARRLRGLLAAESWSVEFGGQHCRRCDGVERVRFGNLEEGCIRRTQRNAGYITYTDVVNRQMQNDKIFFSFIKIHTT